MLFALGHVITHYAHQASDGLLTVLCIRSVGVVCVTDIIIYWYSILVWNCLSWPTGAGYSLGSKTRGRKKEYK